MRFVYTTFFKGLVTLLPLSITIYLIIWLASGLESLFGSPLKGILPEAFYFPGSGLILAFVLIFLFGLLVNHYITASLFQIVESYLQKIPLVKVIYNPLEIL